MRSDIRPENIELTRQLSSLALGNSIWRSISLIKPQMLLLLLLPTRSAPRWPFPLGPLGRRALITPSPQFKLRNRAREVMRLRVMRVVLLQLFFWNGQSLNFSGFIPSLFSKLLIISLDLVNYATDHSILSSAKMLVFNCFCLDSICPCEPDSLGLKNKRLRG